MNRVGIALLFLVFLISCQPPIANQKISNAANFASESCKLDSDCYLVNITTGMGPSCCERADLSQAEWIAANVKSPKFPRIIQPCNAMCIAPTNVPLSYSQTVKCINSICKKVPDTQQGFISQPEVFPTTSTLTKVDNSVTATNTFINQGTSESCSTDNQCYLVNTATGQGPACCSGLVDFSQDAWIAANVNSSTYPRRQQGVCNAKCAKLEVPLSYQQTAKCINSVCQKVPSNQQAVSPLSNTNTVTGTNTFTNQGTSESCSTDNQCYLVNTTTGQGPGCCPGLIDFSQSDWISVNVNSTKYPKAAPQVCRAACARLQVPSSFHKTAKCVNSICQKVP